MSEPKDEKDNIRIAILDQETKQMLLDRDGNKCQISGEPFENFDEIAVEHIVPLSIGGTHQLDNLQLVKAGTGSSAINMNTRRIQALTKQLIKRQDELAKREEDSFNRELEYRSQIDKQKIELERLRNDLLAENEEQKSRIDLETKQQKDKLLEQLLRVENREKEAITLKKILNDKIAAQEHDHKNSLEELEREKERYREESRNQIQARSNNYVTEAIKALDTSANNYHSKGLRWSAIGLLSLVGGVGTGIYFGLGSMAALETSDKISWPVVSFLAFKGVIVIALFVAIAKYCFTYSQSFTHEAIKNSERMHAINFGKFYLETYGVEAEWTQIKEAFEHWNINSSSAFSKGDPDKFDPKLFDKMMQISDSIQKFGGFKKRSSTNKKNDT